MKIPFKIKLYLIIILLIYLYFADIKAQWILFNSGVGNLTMMLMAFIFAYFIIDVILMALFWKWWKRSSLQLSFWVSLVMLVLVEITLRSVTGTSYRCYSELNGDPIITLST